MEEERERNQSPVVSGDGKLLIKLKIGRVEDDLDDDQAESELLLLTRVCDVCNKRFKSGKALGGHRRVHFQANNNRQQLSLQKKMIKPEYVSDDDNSMIKPVCSLCGKRFKNMKSLFGHMRCHPERLWRGIKPPPSKAKNSSSSSLSDATPERLDLQIDSHDNADKIGVTDLTESLPSWSKRDKRGRKAIRARRRRRSTDSSSEEEEEDSQLNEAVIDLMRLANGGNSIDDSGLTLKHFLTAAADEFEATNSNSTTNKANYNNTEEKNWGFESKKRKTEYKREFHHVSRGKANVEHELASEEPVMIMNYCNSACSDWNLGHDDDPDHEKSSENKGSDESVRSAQLVVVNHRCEPIVALRNKMIKRRKKMKLRDLESVQFGNRYKCSTCNKCFSTHQALGGHRSSHNKTRNPQIVIENDDQSVNAMEMEQIEMEVEVPHQCKVCNKTFPTGQALGGHKRCHWTSSAEAPSSQVTSPGEASQTGRKVLDFDLNKPASMEDQEEEEEGGGGGVESHHHDEAANYGYGYPSSSSNNSIA